MLSWNVRGLNNPARQHEMGQVIQLHKPHIVCLQETKMAHIDNRIINNSLGPQYVNNFMFLSAKETRGGIILAYRDDHIHLQHTNSTTNTISALVTDNRHHMQWTPTGVYGQQPELDKKMFIREIKNLKDSAQDAWLVVVYFNLIYKEEDKNNDRLNQRMMLRFRRALNCLEVKELRLIGRKYT